MTSILEVAFLLITLGLFSIISHKKRLLSFDGIMIGNIIGLIVFLNGGLHAFSTLLLFFMVAEIATIYPKAKKKHEQRNEWNILGNGGPAALAILFGFKIAFFGAVAAALADTLSSEIGILSKKKPVLITNLKKEVEPGTDGGVTILGILAAVVGASLIALSAFYAFPNAYLAVILIVSGVLGSLFDSILGARFEIKGQLNNTQVNFLGSLCGATLSLIACSLLGINI